MELTKRLIIIYISFLFLVPSTFLFTVPDTVYGESIEFEKIGSLPCRSSLGDITASWDYAGSNFLIAGGQDLFGHLPCHTRFISRSYGSGLATVEYVSDPYADDRRYTCVACHPIEDYALLTDYNGSLWKLNSDYELELIKSYDNESLYEITWEPNGTYALIGGPDFILKYDGSTLQEINSSGYGFRSASWDPQGKYVLLAGYGYIDVIGKYDGTEFTTISTAGPGFYDFEAQEVAFSPNSEFALISMQNTMVDCICHSLVGYNGTSFEVIEDINDESCTDIYWHPNGSYALLYGRMDLRYASNGTVYEKDIGSNGNPLGFSPDGEYLMFYKTGDSYDEHDVWKWMPGMLEKPTERVQIISPKNNTVVKGKVVIKAEVEACKCNGKTSLYVDNKFNKTGTRTDTIEIEGEWYELFEHSWESSKVSNGAHVIKVVGKHGELYDEITLIVDNPGGGETYKNTRITAPANSSDVSGVVTIEVEVQNCNCSAATELYIDDEFSSKGTYKEMVKHGGVWFEVYSHQWDSTEVVNGWHHIMALGKHNNYSDEITVNVDNNGGGQSEQNTRIVSPADYDEVAGIVTIKVEVMACYCAGKTTLYVNSEKISTGTAKGMSPEDDMYELFEHEWDSTEVANGQHLIKVLGKHSEYSDEITLTVNNPGGGQPYKNTRIISPLNNSEVKGTVIFKVEVKTCNCTAASKLYINDKFVSSGTSKNSIQHGGQWFQVFEHEWDSTEVANGEHKITIYGKHDEYFDEIYITVKNAEQTEEEETGEGDDNKFSKQNEKYIVLFIIPIMIVVIGVIMVVLKRNKEED